MKVVERKRGVVEKEETKKGKSQGQPATFGPICINKKVLS